MKTKQFLDRTADNDAAALCLIVPLPNARGFNLCLTPAFDSSHLNKVKGTSKVVFSWASQVVFLVKGTKSQVKSPNLCFDHTWA